MPAQDTSQLKEKILSIIRHRGPSLPVHIAKETGLSILFASAFLSELLSEKTIQTSNIRVGSSPLYLIRGQESKLESFSNFLNSKEKDAFNLLKQRKFLKDSEQEPAIRVALRAIRDFAIPFKHNEEIYWKYFTAPQEEFKITEIKIELPAHQIEPKPELPTLSKPGEPIIKKSDEEDKKPVAPKEEKLDIFERKKETFSKPKKTEKKKSKKNSKSKQDDKFFNKVKEFLQSKSIEIIDIESFNKTELVLRIKKNGEEKLLIAYSKKKISGDEIIRAYKKSQEYHLPPIILATGEPPKKLSSLIDAIKTLDKIETIE